MPEEKVISKSVAKRLAIQKAAKAGISEPPVEDLRMLRELLWFRHGCDIKYLYGDDGEMQCNHCMIDFKRDTAISIYNTLEKIGIAKMAKAMSNVEFSMKAIGFQHRAENAKKD